MGASTSQGHETVDIYLVGGQSNANGQGYLAKLPDDFRIDTRVLLFHSAGNIQSGAEPNTWLPLRQASETPDRFGLEIGFGNRMMELAPESAVALIKHAWSGTNLYSDWNPGAGPDDREHWGEQFAMLVDTVGAGLAALRARGLHAIIRGMIWHQGESDAKTEHAARYGENFRRFIDRVRQQFDAPDLVFVYGYVLPPPNVGFGRDLVRDAQRQVDQDSGSPLAVPGAHVVETDDLSLRANDPDTPYPNDIVHFGTAGILEMGRRMAEKMNDRLPKH